MMPASRRPFLILKRYGLRRRSRTIAQAKRALDPHTWAVASPLPSPGTVAKFEARYLGAATVRVS